MESEGLNKGELKNKIGEANATASLYNGDSNIYGLKSVASATGMQYGATGTAGTEDTLYALAKGDVTLATADTKLVAELYAGSKGRYGFNVEGGMGAAAVKESIEGEISLYGVVILNAKAGAHLGAIGTSGVLLPI